MSVSQKTVKVYNLRDPISGFILAGDAISRYVQEFLISEELPFSA